MLTGVFNGESRTLEYSATGLKGRLIWLYSRAVPLRNEKGEIVSMLSATVDITQRREAEDRIREALEEKEVLLKEIHHRVKNNMAIVSALLKLQARHSDSDEIKRILEDSQNRINSMALVHERLYESRSLARISVRSYVTELAEHLLEGYSSKRILLVLELDDMELDIDHIIPLGLILNELVTNSIKHAFTGCESPEIGIHLSKKGGVVNLSYHDNGRGVPEGINLHDSESLGLKIIHMLAYQLSGNIELDGASRSRYTLSFPL